MEEDCEDPEQGGGEDAGVWRFLKICSTVRVDLCCGDVGGHPPHGMDTGGFPMPGGTETNGAAAMAEAVQEMGVHFGGGNEI